MPEKCLFLSMDYKKSLDNWLRCKCLHCRWLKWGEVYPPLEHGKMQTVKVTGQAQDLRTHTTSLCLVLLIFISVLMVGNTPALMIPSSFLSLLTVSCWQIFKMVLRSRSAVCQVFKTEKALENNKYFVFIKKLYIYKEIILQLFPKN